MGGARRAYPCVHARQMLGRAYFGNGAYPPALAESFHRGPFWLLQTAHNARPLALFICSQRRSGAYSEYGGMWGE